MIHSANRSRLFELRHERVAAVRSAELLERKREVLLHEIAIRTAARDALKKELVEPIGEARRKLHEAILDCGRHAIGAAALAQPPRCTVEAKPLSVMSVPLVQLLVNIEPYRGFYGTAATSASTDEAGRAYRALIEPLVHLAEAERSLLRLGTAMRKTTRLLNALQKVIVPGIDRELRMIVDELEEEERDEAVRMRV